MNKNINCKGKLVDLNEPKVMGILNITPDSFYENSRVNSIEFALKKVEEMILEGVEMIDIGAYSSRPGAAEVSESEELERLEPVLKALVEKYPDLIISIDTFRSKVAEKSIALGAAIINDISGGGADEKMFETIARLKVPYILMHTKGTPKTMQSLANYDDIFKEMILYFSEKISQLRKLGVNDIIIDPGFGFAKTLEQNYFLMKHLKRFQILDCPILVGISRKSMIYKFLNIQAEHALNGTTVLNTLAIEKGASILRVHDVKAAKECVNIVNFTKNINL
jgi:dihydropteroate synthase